MIYIQLFFSFLQVGLFSFGGGYAAMPLIQGQVVTMHQWLSMSEFTDLITISQMTPGPIAVNSATFVGIKARCDSCDSRVYTSILYPCYGDCKIVFEIPEYGAASGCAWLSASCGGGDDRISRDSDPDLGILGQCISNIL